jgi:excisionase family DNA binding protein
MSAPGLPIPKIFHNCITVKDAASHSGYNLQYLRRMLRSGALSGIKIGQMWLIDKTMFEGYMQNAYQTADKQFGPK